MIEAPPVLKQMCATCPFRDGSPYSDLREHLSRSALTESSRICHSTGSNAINHRTGKEPRTCRGARDLQLKLFTALGLLKDPTDEEWTRVWNKMKSMKKGKK